MPTTVRDARDIERQGGKFRLCTHGFELVTGCGAGVPPEAYESNQQALISSTHQSEVVAAVQRAMPGAEVMAFHNQVRSSATTRMDGHLKKPAVAAHCDYTVHTAVSFFDMVAKPPQRKGRFAIVNAWRNVAATPVKDYHLACCDHRTVVAPDDFVHCKVLTPGGEDPETYRLDPSHKDNPGHRWWHYPGMVRSEILLFMQYDSNPASSARYCFHTAVKDPKAPAGATRMSCETRCIVFFPSHTPCTIPAVVTKGSEKVGRAIEKLTTALSYPDKWPPIARMWMVNGLWNRGPAGPEQTLREWVWFSGSKLGQFGMTFGLDQLSEQEKEQVLQGMMEGGKFETLAKQGFPRPVAGNRQAGCAQQ
eukprot:TRINITY_DN27867_c0_g1_i1.p1 TRINITY_DN27867_c0_g1~~TRINITY_DN27867_c0_g1_i1.p1  ORF type:complete len:421 (+),score=138.33 TRINITY_DN27867_c0_g1_i1:172-1263(+)